MEIPEAVEEKAIQLSAEMQIWAYRAVGSFAAKLHPQDRMALADDLVQRTWLWVIEAPEPSEQIQNWGAFLRKVLLLKCHEAGREEQKWRRTAGEPSSRSDTEELSAVGPPTPEDCLRLQDMDEVLQSLWPIVEETSREYICNELGLTKETLEAFLEIVSRYADSPACGFDTARQLVDRPETPNKPTAARWWKAIRQRLAAKLRGRGAWV
jgi:DNA-directed RNA polymerase specialized sigma24 family protein